MAIETVVEEVALNLEETAQAVRLLNGRTVSFGLGGMLIGAAAGGYFGYQLAKKRTRAEALAEADREIEEMRKFYRNQYTNEDAVFNPSIRPLVVEPATNVGEVVTGPPGPKPTLQSIVKERGYAGEDPDTMAMDEESSLAPTRPTRPPVPVREPAPVEHVEPTSFPEWNEALEQARRDVTKPYVISRTEWDESLYEKLQYTYYDDDDVLVDEDGNVVSDPEAILGEFSYRFGYGSGDGAVVFVQNDQLQKDFEITKRPEAYEEVVLGLDPHDES